MSDETKKVCVIEDNKPIQKLLTTIIEKAGLPTVAFGDGESAIAWLKSNTPLIVLADFVLPDLDGSAIIEFVRSQQGGTEIPVVAVTGLAQENDKEKIMNMGFDSYIAKPIQTGKFVDQIKEIIEKKKG